jgi:hypothetical protein
METITARQGKVIIQWNGVNVTDQVSRFASSITYTDHEEEASDELTLQMDNGQGLWSGDWYPSEGDTLQVYLGYSDALIDCGLFEVDEITLSGPPDMIEVKCIAAGITKALRTKTSKAFQSQTLRQIAQYFCSKHGFTLIDDTSGMLSQINMSRKTQDEKTDLQFLSELATEYGFIFSVRGTKMVFTSYYNLDNADSVGALDKNQLSAYSLTAKTYDTYSIGNISRRDSKSNKVVAWKATDTLQTAVSDQALFSGRVENSQQAEMKVKGGLWRKNKFKQAGRLNDIPGDPALVSGVNMDLTGLGALSGKYHITTATHVISGDGAYTTSLEVRLTGSIPQVKRVPKTRAEATSQYDANGDDYLETENADENQDSN